MLDLADFYSIFHYKLIEINICQVISKLFSDDFLLFFPMVNKESLGFWTVGWTEEVKDVELEPETLMSPFLCFMTFHKLNNLLINCRNIPLWHGKMIQTHIWKQPQAVGRGCVLCVLKRTMSHCQFVCVVFEL